MNVSSILTNTTIWFVAALSLIVDVRTDSQTDIFTRFIKSSLRRWPKNWVVEWWRGYASGSRCRFAYGPADATV